MWDDKPKEITKTIPVTIQVNPIYPELCDWSCNFKYSEDYDFCLLFRCNLKRPTDKQEEELYPEYEFGDQRFRCDICLKRFGV